MTQPPGYGPPPGYPPPGYPPPGYPPPGYPPPGYPPPGYPPPGYRPAWQPPPPALSPGGAPLADFGTRLLSWLIDAALVSIVGLGVAVPLGFWFLSTRFSRLDALGPTPGLGQVFSAFFLPLLLVEASVIAFQLVCYYVYSVELMYRSGQTLGKRIMKIRIVPLDPAATLTRGMAAKRYLVEFVGGTLIPYFHYVDGLWQLWDKPFQQTLHDKVARTAVVKVSA